MEKKTTEVPENALAAFDPWKQQRPKRKSVKVELARIGVTVTLVALDVSASCRAASESQQLAAGYVATEENPDPGAYIGGDSRGYELTEIHIGDLCMLRAMQPESERKPFDWWLGFSLNCPEEYGELLVAAQKLNRRERQRDRAGNSTTTAGSTTP